jgi:NAD(P)-dependent dehydrogenase (short-subunit alcohol dehydrogenase family)
LKAALPFLNDKSSITLITAITGTGKIPGTSGIGAINGALEIMVSILAKELKPLRVNAISPGVVDTPWWNFLPEDTKQETFAQYAAQIAVGRIANPDDIADAILFVAENEYMTGQIIGCDGGLV